MLVFVDESGDPGLKLDQGSSNYFIVILVLFEDERDAQDLDLRINLLRKEFAFHNEFEFKFNNLRSDYRIKFLEAISPYSFLYHGIVINKEKLFGRGFQYKGSFYKYACSLVFQNAKPYLDSAVVFVDGSGSKEFRFQLQKYLKDRINQKNSWSRYISSVKIQDSKKNNLLQVADMIAGAVGRSYKYDKKDHNLYRDIIKHREIFVQFWPK
ncbi:DUF3800 domain-containing protein [candidate division KSB1 bacterium]|nr:DUF3800 domain-containing protein [candidate division KSB1 bacterium]